MASDRPFFSDLYSAIIPLFLICNACFGQASEPIELSVWPDRAPGLEADAKLENVVESDERIGRRVTKVAKPMLTVYKPSKDKDTGAAVVICPGGGYHILALDLEGVEVAKWLNEIGITGIVLQYRVPKSEAAPKHLAPLQDVQRAMSLVREHAKEWEIDPQRIGLMGFSAGGHLTATAGTNFSKRSYELIDESDKTSCRPDFLMLIYPAYLTAEDSETALAPELSVNSETPATLLIHAGNDNVSATNSVAFYLALKRAKVPAELHIYPSGGHGYGLRPSEHAVSSWPDRAERFLKSISVLKPAE